MEANEHSTAQTVFECKCGRAPRASEDHNVQMGLYSWVGLGGNALSKFVPVKEFESALERLCIAVREA